MGEGTGDSEASEARRHDPAEGFRSLEDLTTHLTTRADDGHAISVLPDARGHLRGSAGSGQVAVRFCA